MEKGGETSQSNFQKSPVTPHLPPPTRVCHRWHAAMFLEPPVEVMSRWHSHRVTRKKLKLQRLSLFQSDTGTAQVNPGV